MIEKGVRQVPKHTFILNALLITGVFALCMALTWQLQHKEHFE